eukprot:CAMPEP_0119394302 /NCGR_PEP_ID=MMETSP1334-20130426/128796_1 /TAXON_ID=127549 /ORGANISM="Calcidiscus leptoporus, Strain RCC1130" /LENGTH=48 /DNA_ID= /DNA_START= /DNA_END= /DNA_ORIENTATION=
MELMSRGRATLRHMHHEYAHTSGAARHKSFNTCSSLDPPPRCVDARVV